MKKILILIIFFYFLALFQTSFLAHFHILGLFSNLILIAVILINFFDPQTKIGVGAALIAGFFLDIFSENFFGFYILILLAVAIFIKFVFKKYVGIPVAKGT